MSSIREQAARWFTRVLHLPGDHPLHEQLRAWLNADPAHAREYQAFCELWGDFSSTRHTQALAQVLERRASRRAFTRNGLLGLVGLLAIGLGWRERRRPVFEQLYSTDIGECSRFLLPDGTELTLAAATRLHVFYEAGQRRVVLLQGSAIFDVAHDADRPFHVDAGLAWVTVLGTRFVVDRAADAVRVSVARGAVQVDGEHNKRMLKAGQVVETHEGGPLEWLSLSANNAFAFEKGRLVFEQADLREIASSLARYLPQPVRVLQGRASPSINAVVQLDDVGGFLQALPSIAPIEVSQRDGVIYLRAR